IGAFGVYDRDQSNNAAVATLPIPGKQRKGAASAGHLVDVAAHILHAENAVLEQNAMARLPFGKILLPVTPARPFLVFPGEMGMERSVALRPDGGCKRMVVGRGIMANHLHLLFNKPFACRSHEA